MMQNSPFCGALCVSQTSLLGYFMLAPVINAWISDPDIPGDLPTVCNKPEFHGQRFSGVVQYTEARKEIAMKRIMIGFVWFVLLYFGILGAGGAIVGSVEGGSQQNVQRGYEAGYNAGEEFGKKYGTSILLVALSGAALGTLTGALPGTKRKTK
jgi:hypothetical protein